MKNKRRKKEAMDLTEVLVIPNLRRTQQDIREAVKLWRDDRAAAEAMYGHISLWNTSAVTDMSALFWYAEDFNDDLSQWDTSSVTDMHWMFFHARSFNSDINMWDTKAVVDMGSMFNNAHAFNCELNNWNTSSVTFMLCMFTNARAFSCDISEWDIHVNAETRGAFFDCPVDYREFWIAHRGDLVWKEQCRQDRELRRELIRVQIKRDANWERRKDWIAVISPFLKLEGVTESPLQVVFDVQDIARLITSFL